MKRIVLSMLLLAIVFMAIPAVADTNLMPIQTSYLVEGMPLPAPYNCIVYGGHNNLTMTLYYSGCGAPYTDIEIYRPWNNHKGYWNFDEKDLYIEEFLFNGEWTRARLYSHP